MTKGHLTRSSVEEIHSIWLKYETGSASPVTTTKGTEHLKSPREIKSITECS